MSDNDSTGVCEKNTPPDKKTGWKISCGNAKSVAGLQLLLLDRLRTPCLSVYMCRLNLRCKKAFDRSSVH